MRDNEKLINQLHDLLDEMIKSLKKVARLETCKRELSDVRGALNQTFNRIQPNDAKRFFPQLIDPYSDVKKVLQRIINQISLEGRLLEKEMHGLNNYSDYQNQRITVYADKKQLKDGLEKMLKLINESSDVIVEKKIVERR